MAKVVEDLHLEKSSYYLTLLFVKCVSHLPIWIPFSLYSFFPLFDKAKDPSLPPMPCLLWVNAVKDIDEIKLHKMGDELPNPKKVTKGLFH